MQIEKTAGTLKPKLSSNTKLVLEPVTAFLFLSSSMSFGDFYSNFYVF